MVFRGRTLRERPARATIPSMERVPPPESLSLVEKKRHEALQEVIGELGERMPQELKKTFESHGREYELTSPEDCMVAFAQQHREAMDDLYAEVVRRDDYRAEQAAAKLLKLFEAYERLVSFYAELRSYYPHAAGAVEEHLPPLSAVAEHGSAAYEQLDR